MNCRQAERLSSYSRDQVLSERQQQALLEHLTACGDCRRREQRYQELVTALGNRLTPDTGSDLMQRAVMQFDDDKAKADTRPAPLRTYLFGKEKRTMLRGLTLTALAVLISGTVVLEFRPQGALGQAALRKMNGSIARVKTLHLVTRAFLPNEEEARNNTWHDGKTPIRFDTWLTRDAMRGGDEFNGPYLWTAKGYLHYDRSVNQVKTMNPGPGQSLKDALGDGFNPLARIRQSAPPGTYLSVKRLDDTRWHEHSVYKLQIASGPKKPLSDEELPDVQEPGKTAPISQSPNIRETFWVDKRTDLPVYSEYEKEIQQRWVVLNRNEFDYTSPIPPSLFDPASVNKELEAFGAAYRKKR